MKLFTARYGFVFSTQMTKGGSLPRFARHWFSPREG